MITSGGNRNPANADRWTATADEIIAKVALLDRDYPKLVANNIK